MFLSKYKNYQQQISGITALTGLLILTANHGFQFD